MSVKDATVNQSDRFFFRRSVIIAVNEIPAATRRVFVRSRNGAVPVFLDVKRVNAFASLEPIDWTTDSPETEKKIGRHFFYRVG